MQKNGKLSFTDNAEDGPEQVVRWIAAAKQLPEKTQRDFLLAYWSRASVAAARERFGLTFAQAMGLVALDAQDKETTNAS